MEKEDSSIVEKLGAYWRQRVKEEEIDAQLALYIPTMLGYTEKDENEQHLSGIEEINHFLSSDKHLMLILGDSGAGKSLFNLWLVKHLWEKNSEFIPIFIHLPTIKIKNGFLQKYLRKHCNLTKSEIEKLKTQQRLLLIFDSYDELKPKYKGKNLHQVGELYQWNAKVILSCRTEALVSYSISQQTDMFVPYAAKERLAHAWEKRYVQAFDPKTQIPEYINQWKRLNSDLVDPAINYFELLTTLPHVSEMVTNPFILWIVLLSLPKILKQYANEKNTLQRMFLTRLSLFTAFTDAWFERQRDKLLKNGMINALWATTIIEDYRVYCEQLANLMWQKKISSVKYENKGDDEWDIFFGLKGFFGGDADKPLHFIRSGALLRIVEGNTFEFLHKALLEYFSAKNMFESATYKANIAMGIELNHQLLIEDLARIRLGADCVRDNPDFEEALWEILEESKYELRVEIAAANAITILSAANRSFAGKDLRNIRIKHANVSGANFDSCNLENADLRGVNFSRAWLNKANLTGACLDDVKFGELHEDTLDDSVRACLYTVDGKYYVVMTQKALYIFSSENNKKIKEFIPKLEAFERLRSLAISFNMTFLLIGTTSGRLLKVNFQSCKLIVKWEKKRCISQIIISSNDSWCVIRHKGSSLERISLVDGKSIDPKPIGFSARWVELNATREWGLICSKNGSEINKWNLLKNETKEIWNGHQDSLLTIAISKDEKWAYSSSRDNTVKKWDVTNGSCVLSWTANLVKRITISCDGTWLLTGNRYNEVKKWDTMHGLFLGTWKGNAKENYYTKKVTALTLSQNDHFALRGSDDHTFICWEIDAVYSEKHKGHSDTINQVVVSSKKSWVISCARDNTLICWDALNGETVFTVKGAKKAYSNQIDSVAITNDEQWLFYGDSSKIHRVNLMERNNNTVSHDSGYDNNWIGCKYPNAHNGPSERVSNILLTPNQHHLVSIELSGYVKVWDTQRGECKLSWPTQFKYETAIAVSAENTWLLTGDREQEEIKKWDLTNGKCLASWNVGQGVFSIAIHNNVAYLGCFGAIIKLDLIHGNKLKFECEAKKINSVALSPDGKWLISGGEDRQVIVWESATGKKRSWYAFSLCIDSIAWAIQDNFVVIGMNDGSVSAWSFKPEMGTLSLLWRTNSWILNANHCNVISGYGLAENFQQLLLNKGANVQISSKRSENILAQREQFMPFDPDHPPQCLFDSTTTIRPEAWAISIVRKKVWDKAKEKDDPTQHAFLILESVEDGNYRVRRIDFVLEKRHHYIQDERTTGRKIGVFGQGLIEVANKSLFDLQSLAPHCCALSQGILPGQGRQLLENIRYAQSQRIGYSITGAGNMYRIFRMKEATVHHNCLSWCEEQLQLIGVKLTKPRWNDGIVNNPRSKMPDKTSKPTSTKDGDQVDEPSSGFSLRNLLSRRKK